METILYDIQMVNICHLKKIIECTTDTEFEYILRALVNNYVSTLVHQLH